MVLIGWPAGSSIAAAAPAAAAAAAAAIVMIEDPGVFEDEMKKKHNML